MKILVTGSRDWTDAEFIRNELVALKPTVIIHGAARGADTIAMTIAKELGIETRAYPAQWKVHGKSAGPIRNQEMLDKEHTKEDPIDLVLAYPLPHSIGTQDMIDRVLVAGIPLHVRGVAIE